MNEDQEFTGEEDFQDDHSFSDDPEENMELENQFLKMKLMAERGAVFFDGQSDLPPEIMNEWLKNVSAFEEKWEQTEAKRLGELLGNPQFKKSEDLNDEQFEQENLALQRLLEENKVVVSFIRERSDRFKYDFITGNLMQEEATLFPGMYTNFIYEEFYPDHDLDIRNRTDEFFAAFFNRQFSDSDSFSFFGDEFIFPDGRLVSLKEMLDRFRNLYDAVPEFENTGYVIENVEFEYHEPNEQNPESMGMGFSEGTVRYEMIFQNGEKKVIDGPFKIYFHLDYDWWSIFFFYLAGFNLLPSQD